MKERREIGRGRNWGREGRKGKEGKEGKERKEKT